MDEFAALGLQARMADLCGHLNVLHAQLAQTVVEAIDGDLWMQSGIKSVEHWLAWQTGLSPAHAKQLVDTARRSAELPVTFAAFADGELSLDQVAVVAKYTPAHNDAEVCQLAKSATVNQLRTVMSRYVHTVGPQPEPEPEPQVSLVVVTRIATCRAGSMSTAVSPCTSTPLQIRAPSSTKPSTKPATPSSCPGTKM